MTSATRARTMSWSQTLASSVSLLQCEFHVQKFGHNMPPFTGSPLYIFTTLKLHCPKFVASGSMALTTLQQSNGELC
jgi:hypothetical protein